MNCNLCPRKCNIDRSLSVGVCGSNDTIKIARAGLHFGEEPCISGPNGSGTIFFSGCNLKCVFCQNTPISRDGYGKEITEKRLIEIFFELKEMGAHNINLVTATHYADKAAKVLQFVKNELNIPVVYNSGGYESVETLKKLSGLVDIYLPDFKYADKELALKYSSAADYPETALEAIKEMYAQVGKCEFADDGMMTKGVIIRHLVLPSHRHDSMKILDIIADNLPIDDIKISLMRQYTPCYKAEEYKEINRTLTTFEYNSVVDYAEKLGFDGFIQDKSSSTLEMTPVWDLSGV